MSCIRFSTTAPRNVLRSLADDPREQVRGFLAVNLFLAADVMQHRVDDPSEVELGLVGWRSVFSQA